jgi:hypothetical protein
MAVWSVLVFAALIVLYLDLAGNFPSLNQQIAIAYLSVIMVWLSNNA